MRKPFLYIMLFTAVIFFSENNILAQSEEIKSDTSYLVKKFQGKPYVFICLSWKEPIQYDTCYEEVSGYKQARYLEFSTTGKLSKPFLELPSELADITPNEIQLLVKEKRDISRSISHKALFSFFSVKIPERFYRMEENKTYPDGLEYLIVMKEKEISLSSIVYIFHLVLIILLVCGIGDFFIKKQKRSGVFFIILGVMEFTLPTYLLGIFFWLNIQTLIMFLLGALLLFAMHKKEKKRIPKRKN